jgi:hypothetical protein
MSAAPTHDSPVPGTLVVDGVVCYASDDDPGVWLYIPAAPVAELAGGKPTVHLWASPASGILQLGADWTVRADALARVEAAVKRAVGAGQPVRLQPAPAVVRQVSLEIAGDQGQPSVVAVSASSGFPPYRAIFRAALDAAKTSAVVAALNGRSGLVSVRYRVAVPLTATASEVVPREVDRIGDISAWFRPGEGASHVTIVPGPGGGTAVPSE